MAEYIDRDKAIEWFKPYLHTEENIPADVVIDDLRSFPAEDMIFGDVPQKLWHLASEIEGELSVDAMLKQLAEEAAELAQAALKYDRALETETALKYVSPTPKTSREAMDNLLEEIADVALCVMVLGIPGLPDKIMLEKAKRWRDRLEQYGKETAGEGL